MIRVKLNSIFVDDQEKAIDFYTNKIGFEKKADLPAGEFRWLTVGQPEDDFELLLEPNIHQAAKAYQSAIFNDGIPATSLFVDDIHKEYEKLKMKNVKFKSAPTAMGNSLVAVFNDTCGNYIQICQIID